jgi:hypothetical protein
VRERERVRERDGERHCDFWCGWRTAQMYISNTRWVVDASGRERDQAQRIAVGARWITALCPQIEKIRRAIRAQAMFLWWCAKLGVVYIGLATGTQLWSSRALFLAARSLIPVDPVPAWLWIETLRVQISMYLGTRDEMWPRWKYGRP